MICPNCGREINDGSTFCPSCGAKMPEQPMYSASPVPPQPPMGQPVYYSGNMNTNVNKPDNTGLVAMVLGIVACASSVLFAVLQALYLALKPVNSLIFRMQNRVRF